ncbi:hypothetical protein ACSW8Q_15875 (plasmid) [Clostridium perfringens]|uniref:Uncharacterized protein n=1 Tax=Clostridium perfringens E str. JGS1987 TaxID=451755 RepID=B1BVT7_CLOPF|nr:hypothetical protein [Clostridium perfringens]EDT14202.1 hypothetical protein AC3_A0672 [Clostridium perfringens E str. JGS1987]ELC8333021.1 hypothetical protein [Clostridium perfringens]ELC8464146.1 hypothetical protein [Clostridium perfringens]MDK0553948.1 hypothetical protein [Clostridium perfringens]
MDKLEFLRLVLNERSSKSIHPMVFCTKDEIHKYNIKEDDFLMIIDEEPYVALSLGSKSWLIKEELDEIDLINKIEREEYKLNLIKTYGKIPTKYLKENWVSSWEVYESCCKEFAKTLKLEIF